MTHKNGRTIYGVSFADIASGERNRCRVNAVMEDPYLVSRGYNPVKLVASGPTRGSPIDRDDLCPEDQAAYDNWLATTKGGCCDTRRA